MRHVLLQECTYSASAEFHWIGECSFEKTGLLARKTVLGGQRILSLIRGFRRFWQEIKQDNCNGRERDGMEMRSRERENIKDETSYNKSVPKQRKRYSNEKPLKPDAILAPNKKKHLGDVC